MILNVSVNELHRPDAQRDERCLGHATPAPAPAAMQPRHGSHDRGRGASGHGYNIPVKDSVTAVDEAGGCKVLLRTSTA